MNEPARTSRKDPRWISAPCALLLACALVLPGCQCGHTAGTGPPRDAAPSSRPAGRPSPRAGAASAATSPRGDEVAALPWHRAFASAGDAMAFLLEKNPRVVGFGEYHQSKGSARVDSSVKRFTGEILPVLAGRATDLVLETWIARGTCGEEEKHVVRQVEKTTERPESTEDELVTLLKRARDLSMQPHILEVSCAEYRILLGRTRWTTRSCSP